MIKKTPPRPFFKPSQRLPYCPRCNRELRVQSRTFLYAVTDLLTSLFAIIAILVLYPLVYVYDKFSS